MRQDINLKDAYVLMYDKTGIRPYALYNSKASEENNALDSYTIHGGENDPIEYIVMEIPKKKLEQVASELAQDNGIVPGMNKIYVNAVGRGTYIVNSVSLKNNTYRVVGYCYAYMLKERTSDDPYENTPYRIIEQILNNSATGEGEAYMTGTLRYWFTDCYGDSNILRFEPNTNLWYILQTCAMYLGCRLFFTGEDAYLIDYRIAPFSTDDDSVPIRSVIPDFRYTREVFFGDNGAPTEKEIPNAVTDFDTIDLYTDDSSKPEYGRVVGQVSLGSEGATTIINKVIVHCANDVVVTVVNDKAQRYYRNTEKTRKDMQNTDVFKEIDVGADIPENGIVYHQGTIFASNILDYRCEGQQSVEFSMKEYQNVNGDIHWMPFFSPGTRIKGINDSLDNISVSNKSVLNSSILKPQKLILSSYVRRFPEGVSTYRFGVISSVDLPSKISELSARQQ